MEIAAEFTGFDLERTLRGLMVICGVTREEIETLLKERRRTREADQSEGLPN